MNRALRLALHYAGRYWWRYVLGLIALFLVDQVNANVPLLSGELTDGLAAGTLVMNVFGSAFNAIYLLQKFAALFGMPMEDFFRNSGIRPEEIWPKGAGTLWTAELYPACGSIRCTARIHPEWKCPSDNAPHSSGSPCSTRRCCPL